MPQFDTATRTTRGAREYQEDTALVWPGTDDPLVPRHDEARPVNGAVLAVLADGMGGHAGGALASRLACEHFLSSFQSSKEAMPTRLIGSLEAANDAIGVRVSQNPMLSGMGSTLVGVSFSDAGVEWVSVGDSPLFLYRRGEVALLNEDHSLAPELDRMAAAGKITHEAARRDPRRHMLRSAVTGEELDMVDVSRRPLALEEGDYVILASDGLQTLEQSEIERIVTAYGNDGAEAVAAALIRAIEAIRDPHQDNATVVVVRPKPDVAPA